MKRPPSPALVSALAVASLLAACGYGWQDEPRMYPPSGAQAGTGQVVQGSRAAGPDEYVVQPGDTLYAIGFKNQIDWKDLVAWNGIGNENLIHPGQIIRLTPPAADDRIQTQPLPVTPLPSAPVVTGSGPAPAPVPTPIPAGAVQPSSIPPASGTVPAPAVPTASKPAVPVLSVPPAPVAMPAAGPAGRWSWPTAGKVLRSYNLAAGSKGIDIGGQLGQPVNAAGPGKVVYSGSALKGYGELVIVKHDDTYLSAYGYNRVRLVKEGDTVRAGQTIAELGVGPEQKPVLHFEIREHGKPVDPMRFLPPP